MSNDQKKTEIVPATAATRFVEGVQKHWTAEFGDAQAWTPLQKTLAQHMYLKVDSALKELEAKRVYKNENHKAPFAWKNVDLYKLSMDSVNRISLGLDALIDNHIHVTPYFNSASGLYDVDLYIGFVGKAYCRIKHSVDELLDVVVELVHANDVFEVHKKGGHDDIESYTFKIVNPFDRGPVVGGFGYLNYKDPIKNKVVLVTMDDFNRSEAAAPSDKFWKEGKHRLQMQYKTVWHRVSEKIQLNPESLNVWQKIEAASLDYIDAEMVSLEAENANGEVLSISDESANEPINMAEPMQDSEPEGEKVPVTASAPTAEVDPDEDPYS